MDYRSHTLGELRAAHVGQNVTLAGWVAKKRDLGDLVFIDLRDRYGVTQLVIDRSTSGEAHLAAQKLHQEDVLLIKGTVRSRGELLNKDLATGAIEVVVAELQVLSSSKVLPFEVRDDLNISDDLRLKYRYLDLRRPRMQQHLALRHRFVKLLRDALDEAGFWEIETPMLVKGTPEGSREYLVPSRLHPGQFYVLPQSPQQMKQLLMVGGIDKYFQIARCFRDEDLRGDRQPEFTQLDMEMSFAGAEDIRQLNEQLLIKLTQTLCPHKRIKQIPFPVLTYREAMDTYGSDKPDIRFGLPIQDATPLFKDSTFGVIQGVLAGGGVVKGLLIPQFDKGRSYVDNKLTPLAQQFGAKGLIYLTYSVEGWQSSIEKYLSAAEKEALTALFCPQPGDAVLLVAAAYRVAVESLGRVRLFLGQELQLIDPQEFAYLWVTEFPLFEKSAEGEVLSVHHPFTSPFPEDMARLESDPFNIRSYTYDIVLNGCEIGGGSIRIHDRDLQDRIFRVLGLDEDDKQRKFGHILEAFSYGVPPHGGIAWGLDRIIMFFADEDNIREVIAFPKNNKAEDLMFGAPSMMPDAALHEANITIKQKL